MSQRSTEPAAPAPFRGHVLHILTPCSLEEMGRAHTSTLVAAVTAVHPCGNLTNVHLVGNAVSVPRLSVPRIKTPISVRCDLTSPEPARPELRPDDRTIFVDLRPKANSKWRSNVASIALARTEARGTISALPHRAATLAACTIGDGRLTSHRSSPSVAAVPPDVSSIAVAS